MRPAARKRGKTISSSPLVRTGWLAAVLGGVLFATWGYIHRDNAPPYLTAIANTLAFIVPLLFLVGLAALYARYEGRVGWLGGTGFVLGFVGSTWGVVLSTVDLPAWYGYLAEKGWGKDWIPPLLDWLPLLFAGLVLVGVAAVRAKAVRGWGPLPLTMGLFGWAYYFTDHPEGIVELRLGHIVFGILFSLSWVVLGYVLWSKRGVVAQRPKPARRASRT